MKLFFIGDLHLGQEKILEFEDSNGNLIRGDLFDSIDQMHGFMIRQWNSVVDKCDRVYVMGDVAFEEDDLCWLKAMNGNKTLVSGNHDTLNVRKYLDVFDNVVGCKKLSVSGQNFILTHIPIHPDCIERFNINIHGHLHHNLIGDDRYVNVSVEQINYTPITIETIMEQYTQQNNLKL